MIIVEHDADRSTLNSEQLSMADFEAAGSTPGSDTAIDHGSGIVGAGA